MASTYELIIKAVDQTSAPLGKVEKGLKQVNTRAVKVNATVKKMNSSFKTIGKAGMKGLGSLTRGLRNVSVAAVAGAGAFAFMAKSTMNTLDTLGKTATKELLPLQPGDVPDTYANVDDLVEQFHYKPATTVQDGIQRFVGWYRDYFKV